MRGLRLTIYTGAVLLTLFSFSEAQRPTVFFISPLEPERGIAPLLRLYGDARRSIQIASYVLTDPEIGRALAEAGARNVRVEIVLDESQALGNKFSQFARLRDSRVNIRIMPSKLGTMTDEFGIIDGRITYVGSGLLHTDFRANPKFANYLIVDDGSTAEIYAREFRKLFENAWRK